METSLAGRVALVAGATRGAGRGIAVELGADRTAPLTEVFGGLVEDAEGRLGQQLAVGVVGRHG